MGRTRQDQPTWRSSSLEKPPSFKPYALTPEELEIARERYHRPAEEALAWYNSQVYQLIVVAEFVKATGQNELVWTAFGSMVFCRDCDIYMA